MSEERLWKFRKPEWLNSVYARNAGVYSAGALVSPRTSQLYEGEGREWATSGRPGHDSGLPQPTAPPRCLLDPIRPS